MENNVQDVKSLFSNLIVKMLKDKKYSFYASVLIYFHLDYNPTSKYLAGVYIKDDIVHIIINDEFLFNLPQNQQFGVLKHEVLHICLNHLTCRNNQDYDHKNWNIATDCAINQEISEYDLPKNCITYSNFKNRLKFGTECIYRQNAEYYYNLLIHKCNDNAMEDLYDNYLIDEIEIEKVDENTFIKNKATIRNIIEKSMSSYPNISSLIRNFLSEEITIAPIQSDIQWKRKIKRQLDEEKISDYNRTFKVRNRRYLDRIDIKGQIRRKEEKVELLLIVDVSSSMEINNIAKGISEVRNFLNTFSYVKITLIQVDTKAHIVEDFDKNMNSFKRISAGGTYVSNALVLAKELNIKYNLAIIVSDCELLQDDIDMIDYLTKVKTFVLKVNDNNGYYTTSNHSISFKNTKIEVLDLN